MESSNLSFISDNSSLIEELLQTIESLNSTMMAMREEIAFLREQLAKMDASLEGKEREQKRLLALIEAKDEDNRRMGKQIADLLGKVAALTNALEDKSHQLSARNRNQFSTKTNRKSTRRVDDNIETSGFIPGDIDLKYVSNCPIRSFG